MIPKTAIVIFATLLVAIEADPPGIGRKVIGERLKGFHDHFTSQANVIKDAGINTDKIMNSLSAQLKSLLQDAIKEMDDSDTKYKKVVADNENLTKEKAQWLKDKAQLEKDKAQLEKDKAALEKDKADLEKDKATMAEKIKKLEKELEDVTKTCHEALTQCKNNIEELGKAIAKLQKENADLTNENKKLKKELKDAKQLCHDSLQGINDQLKELKGQVDNLIVERNNLKNKLKECEEEKEKVTKVCYDALTDCKNKIKDLGKELQQCQKRPAPSCKAQEAEIARLKKQNHKLNVELEVCKGPEGWENVNGRYVKHFNDQKVTWSEAKASCEEHNAKLLMVKDDVTQEWTKKIHTPVWIGATDQGHEGDWKWVDGSSVDKTKKSKHWGAGEPDSGLGLVDEDCLATGFELLWIHHGQWADEVCKSKFTFACELPTV